MSEDTLLAGVFQAGYDAGTIDGFEDGYRGGWDAAEDVTVSRLALALQNGLPDLNAGRQYSELRVAREAGPCPDPRCGACVVRREWLDRNGGDYPGRTALRAVAS